jgi:RNA polymerase sigma-70 factor, ECF subfamily
MTSLSVGDIEAHRAELRVYCCRLLGCPYEADDAVQETLLRAWRGAARFEGRSGVRTWLYRIATNVCTDMRQRRGRVGIPTEECPDVPADGVDVDPETLALRHEQVELALVATMRTLPPRQRTILFLRDVLSWRAAEVAELLGMSVVAVNSALQRARATLDGSDPSHLLALAATA